MLDSCVLLRDTGSRHIGERIRELCFRSILHADQIAGPLARCFEVYGARAAAVTKSSGPAWDAQAGLTLAVSLSVANVATRANAGRVGSEQMWQRVASRQMKD